MKIIKNTSPYSNRQLRKAFTVAKNLIAKYEGKPQWWHRLRVTACTRHDGFTSGRCWIDQKRIHLSIGRRGDVFTCSEREMISLVYHELMHAFGYESHRNRQCEPHRNDLDLMLMKYQS